uniref:Peptidase S1 domain-containing protein n=1 Tax=Romanomermis culicivorax TaxID=13658 RepID=A0A915ISZ9_ROMCU
VNYGAPLICESKNKRIVQGFISQVVPTHLGRLFGTRQIYSSVSAHHDWIDTKLKPIPTPKTS